VDFETVYFGTQYVDDNCAMIQFFYNIDMAWRERKHYRMTVNFECGDSKYNFEYPVTFKSHTHFLTLQKPLLWWPNGMGEQNLYGVTINLYDGEEIIAQRSLNYGVRLLKLKRQPFYGERDNFCFYINGKYFKCLGSNIVPLDVLHSKIDSKYPSLVNALAESNTNMVRIWGGGVYPSDEFFDLCDKTGIVVWHDFMLSCHSYPHSDELQNELKSEVEKFIKSDWFLLLTDIDPDVFLEKLKRSV
jgi:beta-mannosidase